MPIDYNRHAILMSRVDAYPMTHVREMINPKDVYVKLMQLVIRMAEHGLIHGDFNEFNLMINDDEKLTLIDFPQMISIDHPDSKFFFDRDVGCVQKYFNRKYNLEFENKPTLADDIKRTAEIDKEIKSSVFMREAIGEDQIAQLDLIEASKEVMGEGDEEEKYLEEGEEDEEEVDNQDKDGDHQEDSKEAEGNNVPEGEGDQYETGKYHLENILN